MIDHAPMVLMRMAYQDRSGTIAVEGRRHDIVGAFRRVKSPTGVKNKSFTRRVLDLDTRPTDLMGAAVNCEYQAHTPALKPMPVRTI